MLGKRSPLYPVGRGRQKKQYWFWFDEQTCHLKYYRNQEAYQHSLFDPLMFVQMLITELIETSTALSLCRAIDLRYATITPPMAAEDLAANQFQIK